MDGNGLGLLLTAVLLGMRHGIDWDHIAAISDIAGSQNDTRRSFVLATLYALGHGLMVLVLGILAIVAGQLIPSSVDHLMEKVVGITLLVLGAYVFYSLARYRRGFKMRSRWMLVIDGARRVVRRLSSRPPHIVEIEHEHPHDHDGDHTHSHAEIDHDLALAASPVAQKTHAHPHRHIVEMPADPFTRYGRASSFGVGVLHGVGAETPSQVAVLVAAAGVGGIAGGLMLLVAFLVGLLISNAAVAIAAAYGFLQAGRSFAVYASIAILAGVTSLALGTLYVLGKGDAIPAILGG
jgi:ABC-type nickel/cobalt efflux system permease component RcnA